MRTLLAVLSVVILLHAPWRLAALVCEAEVMHPGRVRMEQGNDGYWHAIELETRLIGVGFSVAYVKGLSYAGQEVYGLTEIAQHKISVDADLSWDARYAVLAHEGGHVLQPIWLDGREPEAFAEMVAMLVAHDGIREHARYLAGLKSEVLVVALSEWQAIYHAAAVLEDR